jgi:uncharacterized membrane protein YphA (DoxX/SURF4 family)
MNVEKRTIKASIMAGFTEIVIGIIMVLTGAATWYFNTFHFFGIMGVCLIMYAYWHLYFLYQDTGEGLWSKKEKKQILKY